MNRNAPLDSTTVKVDSQAKFESEGGLYNPKDDLYYYMPRFAEFKATGDIKITLKQNTPIQGEDGAKLEVSQEITANATLLEPADIVITSEVLCRFKKN